MTDDARRADGWTAAASKWVMDNSPATERMILAWKNASLPECDVKALLDQIVADAVAQQAEEIARLRQLAHVSEEGTACANCHAPEHAFMEPQFTNAREEVARLRAELARLQQFEPKKCPRCGWYIGHSRECAESWDSTKTMDQQEPLPDGR